MKIPNMIEFDRVLERLAQKTVSDPGEQAAKKIKPSIELREIEFSMQKTMEAEAIYLKNSKYPMRGFSFVNSELKRVKTGASLSPGELLRLSKVLKAAKHASFLAKDETAIIIPAMARELYYDDYITNRVDECIISDDEIADTASAELSRIRRAIRKENDFIKEKLQSMIRSQGNFLQDAIVTQRSGRYVLPVKTEHKNNVPGIVHEKSASGATVFIEPAGVVEANNRIREYEGAQMAEIARILSELSALMGGCREEIAQNIKLLTELDVLFAKAVLAREMNALPVEWNKNKEIKIIEGRHPLIDEKKVVPVTVHMNGGISALIITGPNTGGKTVTLKLVGLFCAMAQSGLFLPTGIKATLPMFDAIYADIGDEQSIEQSLSTFSSHMKRIIYAVKHASENSLVLLDELGSGTDPQEGSALAQAILTELYNKGCMMIATTHIGELKAFAVKNEGFSNAAMEFNTSTLTPTYQLIMGVAGRSNALFIARSLGLPKAIVKDAEGFMKSETVEYNRLIEKAEKSRAKAVANLKKANEMLDAARKTKEKAEKKAEKEELRRKKALQNANEKAIEIINDAKETAEEAIAVAKKLNKKSEAERTKQTKHIRDKLTDKKQNIEAHSKLKKTVVPVKETELHEGDSVLIISMDVVATVTEPPNRKGLVKLRAGIMNLELPISALAKADAPAQEQRQKYDRVEVSSRRNISMSLDLHGYAVDEAIMEIDQYLDDAFLSGLAQVSIVHGRGTGTLRKGVWNYLRNHPHVKNMRQGEYNEGGIGATIVTLK